MSRRFIPFFVPVPQEPMPLWRFEGDWTAEEEAIVQRVMRRYEYRHRRTGILGRGILRMPRKTWQLVCRRSGTGADFHAVYGGEVALYGGSAEELARRIEEYYRRGKVSPPISVQEEAVSDEGDEESSWTAQLRALREADEEKRREEEQGTAGPSKREEAARVLSLSQAHRLMREVQQALLGGEGVIKVYEEIEGYRVALVLMWQGPISAARKPDRIEEPYSYILVGVKEEKVWVNGQAMAEVSPEALKAGLLEACKKPGQRWARRE